jgi:hypothetical protein
MEKNRFIEPGQASSLLYSTFFRGVLVLSDLFRSVEPPVIFSFVTPLIYYKDNHIGRSLQQGIVEDGDRMAEP